MTEEYRPPPPEEVQTRESDTVIVPETREISDALKEMGMNDPEWQEFTSHLKAIFPRELAFHQAS